MKTFNELKRLSKANGVDDSLPTVKVSVLGDSATQLLSMALIGEGVRRGYNVDLWEGDYNQVERQILDPSSEYSQFGATYTIIFQSTHKLLEKYSNLQPSEWNSLADERLSLIEQFCNLIGKKIIYFNYPEIDDAVYGSYANKTDKSFTYQIRKLNYGLMNLAQKHQNLFICDIASLQNQLGRNYFFDASIYVSTDLLLSINVLPIVVSRTFDVIDSIEGKLKKCLILDLDNTIWGGIVGDDGWEGIQLGHGLGIGKAFTEFQEWIKKLKNRGVIICVCSKNDETRAKEAFLKNPEMVLTLEDISLFVSNWENKADNIRTIQRVLNIGFDSMVFVDDNPFERNIVRENIPNILVPELPEDPGDYLEFLYSLNLFETASHSTLDSERTKQYQIEAKRLSEAVHYTNESDFLKSLEMLAEVSAFTKFNIPRVAQLSQRSNQFNLRTVRYSEDQILAVVNNPMQKGFAFSLRDKFGDNGLISVVILNTLNKDSLFVDTLFMSCRVLKRGMENFILNTIVKWAQEQGFQEIIGEYLPTAKNNLVKDFYKDMGFEEVTGAQSSLWSLKTRDYVPRECYINVDAYENQ